MIQVNVHEAKTRLSQLLAKVEEGEEVIISKAGKPTARLVPMPKHGGVKIGLYKGKIQLPIDIDKPLPKEVIAAFYGETR